MARNFNGTTVGLVGYGAIGRIVARILQAFGSTVIAYDPYADAADLAADGVVTADLDTVLRRSGVVSLHARLTPETQHMIDERALQLLPHGAVLVNAARGGLLDYAPLPEMLRSGRLGALALDVYDIEPPPSDWPLFSAPNVVCIAAPGRSDRADSHPCSFDRRQRCRGLRGRPGSCPRRQPGRARRARPGGSAVTDPRGATLAVDVGTSLIKAVVFDERGREQLAIARSTVIDSPHPGWAEQDMIAVRDAVGDCIADAVRQYKHPIARVALTAQGDGAWLIGNDGAPVRPAVLWNDARAARIVEKWTRDGVLDQAFRINGSLGNLGLPNAILAWFIAEDPDALADVRDVATCGSWLFESLTGARGLHPSEASAPWIDVLTAQYSDELFELFGLSAVRGLVPPVLSDDELTRPLPLPGAAARTGLAVGIPVTLAPYDVVTTATGGGSVAVGSAFCILGTTLCTGSIVDTIDTAGTPTGLALLSGGDRPMTRAFPTLSGTGVVEWARELLGLDDAASLTDLARRSEPGAGGIRMWPYLSPAGERMPFLDADAHGVMGGITFGNGPADIARSHAGRSRARHPRVPRRRSDP